VVAACAHCCAFIGSLEGQLSAIFSEARFTPVMASVSDMVRGWEASLGYCGPAAAGVRCSQGCGEIYCSEACRDAQFRHSHNLLCVGPIDREDHPLIQYKYHALEHADTLLLAAQAIAHLVNRAKAAGGGRDATRRLMAELLCFCHAPFREACRPPPGRGKDQEFYAHTDGLLNRAAELLFAALRQHAPEEAAALFEGGAAFLSELMGLFEYNNIDVEVPSPLGSLFVSRAAALDAAARSGTHEAARAASELQMLERLLREKEWVMKCVWGEETTGIFDADDEANSSMTDVPAAITNAMGEVDAEGHDPKLASHAMDDARRAVEQMSLQQLLEAPWPPLHGTALFATVARMNHSCAPNAKIEFPSNSARLSAIALSPLSPGDEMSISYIRQEADVKERKQQLLEYGFVCSCERCLREDSAGVRKAGKRLK